MTTVGPAAWIDESGSDRRLDPGTYILTATVTAPGLEDDVREVMRNLKLTSGGKKLHWHNESHKRRQHISETVAALDGVHHLVIVRAGRESERSERRRRLCLKTLFWELQELGGINLATFEARGPADDKKDIVMLNSLRGEGAVSANFRVRHMAGPAEPLLWMPDAVCGAVVAERTGQSEYLKVYDINAKIRIIGT